MHTWKRHVNIRNVKQEEKKKIELKKKSYSEIMQAYSF